MPKLESKHIPRIYILLRKQIHSTVVLVKLKPRCIFNIPMQSRGPGEKGINAPGGMSFIFVSLNLSGLNFEGSGKFVLSWIYCDFNKTGWKGSTSSFKAWWSLFNPHVWIAVCTSVCMTAFTLHLTLSRRRRSSTYHFTDYLFITIRGVLRQDGLIRNKLLVLCSCIALIYTSLYENAITSELIAPDKTILVNSFKDLIDLGYKLIIGAGDQEIEDYYNHNNKLYNSKYHARDYIYQHTAAAFLSEMGNYHSEVANSSLRYWPPCFETHTYCESMSRYISILSENKSCFLAKTKNDFYFDLMLGQTYFDDEISKTALRFNSFGLVKFWRELSYIVTEQLILMINCGCGFGWCD